MYNFWCPWLEQRGEKVNFLVSTFQELFECLSVLEGIFDNKKTVKANEVEVYSNVLLAWALLLSVTPSEQAYQRINK